MMLPLKIVLRNVWRHKLRAGLTFLTFFFAALLIHLYVGGQSALKGIFEDPFFTGTMLVKARIGAPMMVSLPNAYAAEVREVPGVVAATAMVEWELPPKDNRTAWMAVGVEPDQFKAIAGKDLDSLPPGVYEEFARDPTALLLSRGAIAGKGWKVGDRIDVPVVAAIESLTDPNFKAPPNARLTGHFVGVVDRGIFSDRLIIVHLSRLEKLYDWHRGGAIIAKYAPGQDPEEVAKRIEAKFSQGGREEVEVMMLDLWVEGFRSFIGQLSTAVLFIIALLGLLGVATMFFNVSTAGIDLLPQIGTLRAVGLTRLGALLILGGEGMLVSFGGALAATAVIYVLTKHTTLIDMSKVDEFLAPVFTVTPDGTAAVLGLALFLGTMGSVLPFIGATRKSVAELRAALR